MYQISMYITQFYTIDMPQSFWVFSQILKKEQLQPWKVASILKNKAKNRFKNIIACKKLTFVFLI